MNKLNKALELLENAQRRARENDDVPTAVTIHLAIAYIENHLDDQEPKDVRLFGGNKLKLVASKGVINE